MVEWRPAFGFEQHYEVSSDGRARRTAPGQNARPGRELKAHVIRHGYRRFAYSVGATTTHVSAHRAVWEAFVGRIPPGLQINHKNGVKDDNRLENLECVTPAENTQHSFRVLGKKPNINPNPGSRNGRAKLTEADIPRVFALRAEGRSQQAIADLVGVDQTSVSRILRGDAWKNTQLDQ